MLLTNPTHRFEIQTEAITLNGKAVFFFDVAPEWYISWGQSPMYRSRRGPLL